MITPCNIRDLPILIEIFQNYYNKDLTLWIRERIYSTVNKLFLYDDTLVVSYEMIGTYKYCIHLVGTSDDLSRLKDFLITTGSWMMENTYCKCILAFADGDNKRLQMLIGLTGGKRLCVIPNANNESSEVLYHYSFKDKEELEGRIKNDNPE